MTHPDGNERYATDDLPWDTGEPDEHLRALVTASRVPHGKAVDVGCGTGTNVTWLAQQGFEASGVDVSPLAIERARAKAAEAGVTGRFEVLDFLNEPIPGAPFDLVFDRGCFHVFDHADQRAQFAARVAQALSPNGLWVSIIGSTEGAPRDHGPPRRSVRDIANAIEPSLELVELRAVEFEAKIPTPARAWLCLSKVRAVPAQPSTQRQ